MKHALSAGLMLIFSLFGPNSGYAQPMTTSTPTTKILAIGTINPGVDPAKVFAILPNEVRDTVDLYLNGKIDQWYSQQERRGVVFILNVTDPAAARDMLEKLPLGQAHLMSFELIPIGPLNSASSVAGHESKPLAWQSGGPCGSLEPGQKRRMSVTGHSRRYCHVRAHVRYPQHRTLRRPTETCLVAAFLRPFCKQWAQPPAAPASGIVRFDDT
jgi:hypothetical protein